MALQSACKGLRCSASYCWVEPAPPLGLVCGIFFAWQVETTAGQDRSEQTCPASGREEGGAVRCGRAGCELHARFPNRSLAPSLSHRSVRRRQDQVIHGICYISTTCSEDRRRHCAPNNTHESPSCHFVQRPQQARTVCALICHH